MKLWKRTVALMLITLLCSLIPVGVLSLYITGKRSLNNALKPMDDSLQMEKISWNNSGTTVNMSRCQKQEKNLIWNSSF